MGGAPYIHVQVYTCTCTFIINVNFVTTRIFNRIVMLKGVLHADILHVHVTVARDDNS